MLHGTTPAARGSSQWMGPAVATAKAHEEAGDRPIMEPVAGLWLGPADHLNHAGTPL